MRTAATQLQRVARQFPGAIAEWTSVVAILLICGIVIVPCHGTSTWAQNGFTGWVVPIANRVADGQILYDDGGHLPIPPVPFVLMSVLFGATGTWIDESLLVFAFRAIAISTLYWALARHLPRPAAFLATLGGVPVILDFQKAILYDAIAQFLVAAIAVIASGHLSPPSSPGGDRRRLAHLGMLGGASAACLLSKQSIAIGAIGGVCGALVLFPAETSIAQRLVHVAAYLTATIIFLALGCIGLSGFMSVSGYFTDVLLTGAEPKGGIPRMLSNLRAFASEIGSLCTPARVLAVASLVALGTVRRASLPEACLDVTAQRSVRGRQEAAVVLACLFGVAAGLYTVFTLGVAPSIFKIGISLTERSPVFGVLPAEILSFGLLLSIAAIAVPKLGFLFPGRPGAPNREAFAVLSLVTLAAAVGHALSTRTFLWTIDNPFVIVALAAVVWPVVVVLQRFARVRPYSAVAVTAAIGFLLSWAMWSTPNAAVAGLRNCTESWPEVRHLRHARLPKDARGMRHLVRLVRGLTPKPEDRVLLLPGDPNVEAWFERPHPLLAGAVVFVDQYWDRYVDEDFARLVAEPPTVIVIGPRKFGQFMMVLNGMSGAARLMARVDNELLPRFYRLVATQRVPVPAMAPGLRDTMEVYVRGSTGAPNRRRTALGAEGTHAHPAARSYGSAARTDRALSA
jgi:hypothetical protein